MILDRALRVGLFGLLLTPLVVSTSLLFPYITGKAFFFRTVVEIGVVLWLVLLWRAPAYRPRRSAILWSVLIFVATTILVTVFSQNPYASFWSNFERMDGLVNQLHLLVYFLILTTIFRTEKVWRWFFHGCLGVGLILIGHSLLQIAGLATISQGRIDATLGNSTYLALYLLFNVFLTAILAFKNWHLGWTRWLYSALVLLQFFVIYKTTTRGTLLGLVAGATIFLVLILFSRQVGKRGRLAAGGVLALFLILGGIFWLARASDFVRQSPTLSRFAAISATETTTESRLTIWGMALEGFKERPILGWGPENFITVFNKFFQPKLWRQEAWFDSSHNAFIDRLTLTGLVGFLAYLGLFVMSLVMLRRTKNILTIEKSLLAGLLVAYAANNLFVFDNLTSHLLFFAVLAYINFRTRPTALEVKPAVRVEAGKLLVGWWLGGGLVIVFGFIFYFVNFKPLTVAGTLINAIRPGGASAAARLSDFRRIFAARTFGSTEATQQLWSLAAQVITNPEVKEDDKIAWRALADEQYQNLGQKFLVDARYHYLYALFLRATNRPDEALPIIERALALSPRKQLFFFEFAANNLALNKRNEALLWLEKAYNLAPDNPQASDLLINIYAESGRYADLVKLWQQRVAVDTQNVQSHFSLAAAYLAAGRRADSVATLEAAIKIDPRVAEQARAIITEIKAGRNPLAN